MGNSDFSHTKTIFFQKMNCQIIFSIFFLGVECEVELSNFDFRRRTTPKENEKRKTKKKILKKMFDKSFFNSDFSHTKTIFSQKMNCQIIDLIFFFRFSFFVFFGGDGVAN